MIYVIRERIDMSVRRIARLATRTGECNQSNHKLLWTKLFRHFKRSRRAGLISRAIMVHHGAPACSRFSNTTGEVKGMEYNISIESVTMAPNTMPNGGALALPNPQRQMMITHQNENKESPEVWLLFRNLARFTAGYSYMFRNCILATGMDTPFEIDRKLATSADRLTPRKFTLKRALPSYKR